MITSATLNELQDDELSSTRGLIDEILRKRDEDRKAKAIEDARATLAAAGLTLKDLNGNGRSRSGKGPVYHTGHSYQHPTNKALVWNGKGKKPNWLLDIEADGKKPLEIA